MKRREEKEQVQLEETKKVRERSHVKYGSGSNVYEEERDAVTCRVTATRNNTKVVRTWYDSEKGKRVSRVKTAGSRGYKNAKRGTVYAAQERGAYIVKTYGSEGKERVGKGRHVYRRGMGVGRAVMLTEFEKGDWKVITVSDATKDPHNGCRRKKRRRI